MSGVRQEFRTLLAKTRRACLSQRLCLRKARTARWMRLSWGIKKILLSPDRHTTNRLVCEYMTQSSHLTILVLKYHLSCP
jgi:hypothetical protein